MVQEEEEEEGSPCRRCTEEERDWSHRKEEEKAEPTRSPCPLYTDALVLIFAKMERPG